MGKMPREIFVTQQKAADGHVIYFVGEDIGDALEEYSIGDEFLSGRYQLVEETKVRIEAVAKGVKP